MCALPTGCHAERRPSEDSAPVLPLARIKLYEAGVGYFERSGVLKPGQGAMLPVPASHIDDALKTLVVLGEKGEVSLSGVEFSSSLSRELAQKMIGLSGGASATMRFSSLLSSVKGEDVEVRFVERSRPAVTGRLVEVLEPKAPPTTKDDDDAGDDAPAPAVTTPGPELTLLLVTHDGEFLRLDAAQVAGVKPSSAAVAARTRAALEGVGPQSAQRLRAFNLLAASKAPITLGYLAETPVWRTTYRLILDDAGDTGVLQGWALLHNDTDEAWRDVKVDLVSGQPDSFLYPLAVPRYATRELTRPPQALKTVPQLFDTTVDEAMEDEDVGEVSAAYGGLGARGTGAGGSGYGAGYGRVEGGATWTPGTSTALQVGNLAQFAPAEGEEVGALFSFALPRPVSLRAHASALVPFMNGEVAARRVTLISAPGEVGRSMLRLLNATKQTLPAGPAAVYERGGFAGEMQLGRMKPGERVFLEFGGDPDVELELLEETVRDEVKRVTMTSGALVEDSVRVRQQRYTVKNRSGARRTVYLSVSAVDNATIEGADEVDYDATVKMPYAVFFAEAGRAAERSLTVTEGLQMRMTATSLTAEALEKLARRPSVPEATRAILEEAAVKFAAAEAAGRGGQEKAKALAVLNGDIERLRGHVGALGDAGGQGGSAAALVKRLLASEDTLVALRAEVEKLNAAREEHLEAAVATLEKLAPTPDAE